LFCGFCELLAGESHLHPRLPERITRRIVRHVEPQRELVDREPALAQPRDLGLIFVAQLRLVARTDCDAGSPQATFHRSAVNAKVTCEAR
jgi:non-ribosomal peptide synthetase component F